MLTLSVLQADVVMFSEASRTGTRFPTDDEIGKIVHTIHAEGESKVTHRYPNLVVRLPSGMTDVERASLLNCMEDTVSRTQFRDG